MYSSFVPIFYPPQIDIVVAADSSRDSELGLKQLRSEEIRGGHFPNVDVSGKLTFHT